MSSNIDRYKKDFERLRQQATLIEKSFMYYAYDEEYEAAVLKSYKGVTDGEQYMLNRYIDFEMGSIIESPINLLPVASSLLPFDP